MLLAFAACDAEAQQPPPGPPPFAGPAIKQAQGVPSGAAPVPASLPAGSSDATGQIASVQAAGTSLVDGTLFASALGSNLRSCATCHDTALGYSITPTAIQAAFATNSGGALFALVDGATCPSDSIATSADKSAAFSLLLSKGLIRIGMAMPANPGFTVSAVNDPYGCSSNSATGLTSSSSGMLSVYRRPLPTTNLRFKDVIMWDGRETGASLQAALTQQAIDAVLIHEQAGGTPSAVQLAAIVAFESAHYTAQSFDDSAGALNAAGATGGPVALAANAQSMAPAYQPWSTLSGSDRLTQAQQSIARGENLFRTRPIQITNVPGLTVPGGSVTGNCATCHTDNGANGVQFLDIGVTGQQPPALDVGGLPLFTLVCSSSRQIFTVTDPGRALVTGQCADIGKTKIPNLRGLAARPPYFHNGSAASLAILVTFYDRRFKIGLSPQDKADLVNYLNAL